MVFIVYKYLGYSTRKCDEWFGGIAEMYYFCSLYGTRKKRNHQGKIEQIGTDLNKLEL